jgi:uncharacterized protein YbjQ (UPF0145 family)
MLLTTTPTIEGKKIERYLGVVAGEAILGANVFRDFFAGIRDIVGGRTQSYERVLADARAMAFTDLEEAAKALGANAVVGIDIDYESVGQSGGMLMVTISGTAVTLS